MTTREELDTAIVDAVDTYMEAKRAELENMVEKATDAWKEDYVDTCSDDNASWNTLRAALVATREHAKEYKEYTQRTKTRKDLVKDVDDAIAAYDVAYVVYADAGYAADTALAATEDARESLKNYDKEEHMKNTSDSRFRNFAEGLCETYQASMLAERAKLVQAVDTSEEALDTARNVFMSSRRAHLIAWDNLKNYDKENTSAIVDNRPEQTPTEKLYYELLYAVGNIFPNETRHETALRYIRKAETTNNSVGCKEPKKENT